MPKPTWIDLFFRIIPDTALVILMGYAFVKRKITKENIKLYVISSLLLALMSYIVRLLPISDMFPILISSIFAIILLVNINKIYVVKAATSTIISFVLSLIAESANMLILKYGYNVEDVKEFFSKASPDTRYISGIPSLILVAIIVISIYYFMAVKKKK